MVFDPLAATLSCQYGGVVSWVTGSRYFDLYVIGLLVGMWCRRTGGVEEARDRRLVLSALVKLPCFAFY